MRALEGRKGDFFKWFLDVVSLEGQTFIKVSAHEKYYYGKKGDSLDVIPVGGLKSPGCQSVLNRFRANFKLIL